MPEARPLRDRLALHHWTLEPLPLAEFLRVARDTGWNAVELRRSSFTKCFEAGMSNAQVVDLIRQSGIRLAVLGTEYGLYFARGEEQRRLLKVLDETCANAVALGCDTIMCAEGHGSGTVREAGANIRAAGDVCARHNVRFAFEFSSAAQVVNHLDVAREVLALASHPACGLLLDAYHLERTGCGGRAFADVPERDIFAFQYSDVPSTPRAPAGRPTDRLPPGRGIVRWREVLTLLTEKNYSGYLSYEAPNPDHWSGLPAEVARAGLEATRARIAEIEPL